MDWFLEEAIGVHVQAAVRVQMKLLDRYIYIRCSNGFGLFFELDDHIFFFLLGLVVGDE